MDARYLFHRGFRCGGNVVTDCHDAMKMFLSHMYPEMKGNVDTFEEWTLDRRELD